MSRREQGGDEQNARNQVGGVLRVLSGAADDNHGGDFEEVLSQSDRRIKSGEGKREAVRILRR